MSTVPTVTPARDHEDRGGTVYDVVLEGGWIVDGSGRPPWRADLAVLDGHIAMVGRIDSSATSTIRIDVRDRYVTPGFIDTHVHADALAVDDDVQLAALRQGVTTMLLGQDGLSFAPASATTVAAVSRYFGPVNGPCPDELADGCSVSDLLAFHDQRTALNVGYLAPAGTIRADVMGYEPGPADDTQLTAMRSSVEQALADGALGLSTGLEYVPGLFAGADELAALCAPVAEAGGVYVTHMRSYEADAWRGLAEVEKVVARSGVAAHVSHLHGPSHMITSLVDQARSAGRDLTFDSYPYLMGSSILAMVALPADVQAAGPDDTVSQLTDPAVRNRLAREWFPAIDEVLDRITLSYVGVGDLAWAEGLALRDAAHRADRSPGELVCDLVVGSATGAGCVFAQPPTNTEADVRRHLRHEAQMVGSDAIFLGSRPHPRGWGAFARVLGRHTRELSDLNWGEAVAHMAGHPARRFNLADRGLLLPGYAADVVVLDPDTVTDTADYANPRSLAEGVEHVLVNGQFALRDGRLTGAHPGRALRRGETLTPRQDRPTTGPLSTRSLATTVGSTAHGASPCPPTGHPGA